MTRAVAFATVCAVLAPPAMLHAQVPEDVLGALSESVSAGDPQRLLALAGDRVEIGLFGAARLYSRAQASHVLTRFFREYPPARLTLREDSSTDTAWFSSADYHRAGGQRPLRVYFRFRLAGGEWRLREMVVLETGAS